LNNQIKSPEKANYHYRTFNVGSVDPIGIFEIENYFNNTITHIGYRSGKVGVKISELNKKQRLDFDRNTLYLTQLAKEKPEIMKEKLDLSVLGVELSINVWREDEIYKVDFQDVFEQYKIPKSKYPAWLGFCILGIALVSVVGCICMILKILEGKDKNKKKWKNKKSKN
jgi:hypothetical protein